MKYRIKEIKTDNVSIFVPQYKGWFNNWHNLNDYNEWNYSFSSKAEAITEINGGISIVSYHYSELK